MKVKKMDKSNAKKLLEELYNDLSSKIDSQEGIISKDHLLDLMRSTVDAVSDLDFELPDALDSLRRSLDDGFKDIAKESIKHYDSTNKKFEELAFKHKQTINDCKDPLINIEDITDKFNVIQSHMIDEVLKANTLISDLTKKVEKLEKTSQIDHLTKVYNRKMLSEHLANVCQHLHFANDIHVFMIDIDDFKIINDRYGHQTGDELLCTVAKTIKQHIRVIDLFTRLGSDEFGVLMSMTDPESAYMVAEKLKHHLVEQARLFGYPVTFSMGLVTYESLPLDINDIIKMADSLMYTAKENGKNRIKRGIINGEASVAMSN